MKKLLLTSLSLLITATALAEAPAPGRYIVQQPDFYRISVATANPEGRGRVALPVIQIPAEEFPQAVASQLPGAPEVPGDPLPEVTILTPGTDSTRPWGIELLGSPANPTGPRVDADPAGLMASHTSTLSVATSVCAIRGSLTQQVRRLPEGLVFVRTAQVMILDRNSRDTSACTQQLQLLMPAMIPLNEEGDRFIEIGDLRSLLDRVQAGLGAQVATVRQIHITAQSPLVSAEAAAPAAPPAEDTPLIPLDPRPVRMPIQ
jgi:hypothetical protein